MCFKRKKRLPERTLNIWNSHDFAMSGLGEKSRIMAMIKHFRRCLKWSRQRVVRGYADCDVWSMFSYLQNLMPDMLQHLKDNRHGSPGFLGENYANEDGILVNDTCHAEWDKILDRMIFLWRETDEETCSKKNPYEDEYMKAFSEFDEKYGFLAKSYRRKPNWKKTKNEVAEEQSISWMKYLNTKKSMRSIGKRMKSLKNTGKNARTRQLTC